MDLHTGKVGRPSRLTPECEAQILDAIQCLTVWKVLLIWRDISFLVKSYLDLRGVVDSVFKNNLPGSNWLDIFVKRHGLTKRLADNVKTNRAEVTQNTINRYFDNLEKTIEGVNQRFDCAFKTLYTVYSLLLIFSVHCS